MLAHFLYPKLSTGCVNETQQQILLSCEYVNKTHSIVICWCNFITEFACVLCIEMANYALCRLCVAEDVTFIKLTKGDPLLDTIFNLTSLEPLPALIETIVLCEECHQSVTRYSEFRVQCQLNDMIFRERLEFDGTVCTDGSYIEDVKVVLIEVDHAQGSNLIDEERPLLEKEHLVEQKNPLTEDSEKKEVPKDKKGTPTVKQTIRQTRSQTKSGTGNDPANENETNPKRKRKCDLETSNRYLPCVQCGKMIRRSNMRKHVETHDPKPPQLFCMHCGKKYRNAGLLKVHINSHHTFERKYECNQCDKVYFLQNSLREHIYAKHSEVKRYECDVCGLKFSNHSKKKYHYIMTHTVAKPYACQYCDKAFKLRSDFTLHVRTHTGEKPFACDLCGKRFNKSYNVVIHKKSHRNDVNLHAGV
ncbi:zinc finger protein 625-like [Anopheles stephensi]|uniref:zinc finger protein 625-like n=1 Tax=Anopheles stephensi TaxID=30069 RepID=UPI0016588B8F|nr:zinc finger protein 625-like [Anopheles stephensi]